MSLLDTITSPEDLRGLSIDDMKKLAHELRVFLVRTVNATGGHLASNLGVVELTIALHASLNAPADKIVWDVGHQAYVHKILTGRRDRFPTLRGEGGISGFPKPLESAYDSFATGHASTSVSAAFGLACARDLRGSNERVCAVIGDGAMTGGLCWEALNNAGQSGKDLTIILNDNDMAIDKSVGSLSRYLNEIRSAPTYATAKRTVSNVLGKIPVLGGGAQKIVETAKSKLKYVFVPGTLFTELGFNYIGPIDGHDIKELLAVLRNTAVMKGPILLHVITKKGKGYPKAEKSPSHYHGVSGCGKTEGGAPAYSDIFGRAVIEAACEDDRVLAICAAMESGTGLSNFARLFPRRFFDVGIAEGHAVTFAAGLAAGGFRPVVAVYSTFLQRAYDQIIHDVCIQNLPVVFAIDRAGVVGGDGETHQGAFDLSYLSHIPNMTVIAPKNGRELAGAIKFAISLGQPCAVRYPRDEDNKCYDDFSGTFTLGKSESLNGGDGRAAVITVGTTAACAEAAIKRLKERGINPMHINARFTAPFDDDMLIRLCDYENILVIEENVSRGGAGEYVAAFCAARGAKARVSAINLKSDFIPHGNRVEILAGFGISEEGIFDAVKGFYT